MLRSKAWSKISLEEKESVEAGYSGSLGLEEFVGKTGLALTTLRPAGTALIEGKRLDVITPGDFIEKDTQITIVSIDGNKIVVDKTKLN